MMIHAIQFTVDLLLSPLTMAILAFVASTAKFYSKQSDNGFARLVMALWFLNLVFNPSVDALTQRIVGRWTLAVMLLVEPLSFMLHKYYEGRYAEAIKKATEPQSGEE